MGCNLVCLNNSGSGEHNRHLSGDNFEIKHEQSPRYEKKASQINSFVLETIQRPSNSSILKVIISKFLIHEKLTKFNLESIRLAKTEKRKSKKRSKKHEKSKRKQTEEPESELEKIVEEPSFIEKRASHDSCDHTNGSIYQNLSREKTSKASDSQVIDDKIEENFEKVQKRKLEIEFDEEYEGHIEDFKDNLNQDIENQDKAKETFDRLPPKSSKVKKRRSTLKVKTKKSFTPESSPHWSSCSNQSWENASDASSLYRSLSQTGNLGIRKLLSIDGVEINCDFTNCPFSGQAKYVWPDKSIYEGSWVNNKMQGTGIMCWPDGRVYKGEFKNGTREGEGTMTWPNGNIYEGSWKSGKQDGPGVLSIKGRDKNVVIRGVWAQGMRTSTVYNA